MSLSEKRVFEIIDNIKAIITNMNAIKEEELEAILQEADKDEATGPVTDPTAFFARGGMFEAIRGTRKVIGDILKFKREVSGIGDFE